MKINIPVISVFALKIILKIMWTLFMRFTFRALLNKSAKIPECRREELSQVVKRHFMVDTLDDVLLQGAIDIDIR